MMLKSYTISVDLPGGYITDQLRQEIVDSGSVSGMDFIIINDGTDSLEIHGDTLVSESGLDTVISSHTPDYVSVIVQNTVQENKTFADDCMQRFKQKNIIEGLSTMDQAAWVHHRMRVVDYTLAEDSSVVKIDLMNLIVSGDIELAYFVMGQMVPDDMTKPYHWWTQARIDWVRNEIATYLGWPLI